MSPHFAKALEEDLANAKERVCEWKMSGLFWAASCIPVVWHDTDPEANEWNYCPYCGSRIKVTE